ncbi:ABC transporter substrate-binding protein [Nocardia sp. NPDC051833]|uniref:ABC transporter substrate-binding protein n=1 Tax=Nocardia sp. NPDC051833 TaxID=3155674 RepID=UPI003412A17D
MFTRPSGRVRAALAVLAVASIAALTGCGTSADEAKDTASGTREVATARGTVSVPSDPKRIVVLNGALAGYLYDLDAPVVAADPRLLGVATPKGEFPQVWAADAKEQGTQVVPTGEDINLEFVAAQRPDLIIGGGQGYPAQQTLNAYDQLSAIAPTALMPATTTDWQEQLRYLADLVGRGDQVDGLLANYRTKLAEVKSAIKIPAGNTTLLQSAKGDKPVVFVPTASLPKLLAEVGFALDTQVKAKAGNPEMPEAADYFSMSPELLNTVVDAPVTFVVTINGGRSLEQLRTDPLYAKLPSFTANTVYELPAISSRPDYRTVMSTLELLKDRFQ